jgi:hypothetical protein
MDYKPGIRNKLFVTPHLYITESGKFVSVQSNNGISIFQSFYDVLGRSLGDAGSSHTSRFGYSVTNYFGVFKVRFVSN